MSVDGDVMSFVSGPMGVQPTVAHPGGPAGSDSARSPRIRCQGTALAMMSESTQEIFTYTIGLHFHINTVTHAMQPCH